MTVSILILVICCIKKRQAKLAAAIAPKSVSRNGGLSGGYGGSFGDGGGHGDVGDSGRGGRDGGAEGVGGGGD